MPWPLPLPPRPPTDAVVVEAAAANDGVVNDVDAGAVVVVLSLADLKELNPLKPLKRLGCSLPFSLCDVVVVAAADDDRPEKPAKG